MVRHIPSVPPQRRRARLRQMPRVPRYRRVVVVLLVTVVPVVGTLDFVSLSTAAESATTELRFQAKTRSMPSWSDVTGWIDRSFHFGSTISAPHVVGPVGNR